MLHLRQQSLCIRDFESEVRGRKDAIDLIANASILKQDDPVHSLKELLQRMIRCTFSDPDSASKVKEELMPILLSAVHADDDNNDIRGRDEGRLVRYIQSAAGDPWLVTFASLSCIRRRFVSVATFEDPLNLGTGGYTGIVNLFALVLAPIEEKETKSAFETAKTLSSLMMDASFRWDLREASCQQELQSAVVRRVNHLMREQRISKQADRSPQPSNGKIINFLSGVRENFSRRLEFYKSDFTDGLTNGRTISKVISSTIYLYFLCILPTVAFGALNLKNTNGLIDTKRALIGEGIGGLLFAILSGQPFVVIATTAPIALCNKIVYDLSLSLDVPFYSLYACVGLFNAGFLALYGILGLNSLIKFSTRSVEEIFAAFIVCCFVSDAWTDFIENVRDNYETKSVSLLFFILKNGTLVLALVLASAKTSRFPSPVLRDNISDYALPIAVIVFSCIGTAAFSDIPIDRHEVTSQISFSVTDFHGLNAGAIAVSLVLGFMISILFFMDQGVSAQLVDSPVHKLKKGNANDMDFIVVAIINVFMSLFGLPWMHGLLPHSPLHVQSLADTEDRLDPSTGRVSRVIVYVRETRLAVIACHVLIVISVLFLPHVFSLIPVPVLDGLFMYCAFASIPGNSFFERLSILCTQQSKYPPLHYVRRCEQRKMHIFTGIQMIQLVILVLVGIVAPWPYFRMTFPVFIALLIPFRHLIVPKIIGRKNIDAIDSFH